MSICKLHLKYILSKKSKILILLSFGLLEFSYLLTAFNYQDYSNSIAIGQFFEESFFISRILVNVVIIFVCTNSLIPANDNYGMMLIPFFKNRHYYIFTKVLVIFVISLIFNVINTQLILLTGQIMIKNFYVAREYRIRIYQLYIITFFYGSISILFAVLFKSLYSSIFIIALLIASMGFTNQKLIDCLKYIFPITNSKGLIYNGSIYFLFVILIVLLIAVMVYNQIDFKK